MLRRSLIASIFVLFAFGLTAFAQGTKITAVRAQLYFETDGTFSEDIFTSEGVALWNTIIGEGWAGGKASNSTFVSVEVAGKDLPLGKVKLDITATSRGKVIGKRLTNVNIYDEKTRFFAGLFLNDTGCERVKITARLIGAPKAAAVTKTIPFNCGE